MLTAVPIHQSADNGLRKKIACISPAQIGLEPIATAVPTATPVSLTPA